MPLDLNGQVLFIEELLFSLLADKFDLNTSKGFFMDVETVRRRIHGEGIPFATVLLPSLGKALDAGLESGEFVIPDGFTASKRYPGLPAFMQDVLIQIFDERGQLRDFLSWVDVIHKAGDPAALSAVQKAAECVGFVRQVAYSNYKLALPRSEELDEQLAAAWVSSDEELRSPDDPYEPLFAEVTREIIADLFMYVDTKRISPRHGPGAVSTGEVGAEKWAFTALYPSLLARYDTSYFVAGEREIADRVRWGNPLPVGDPDGVNRAAPEGVRHRNGATPAALSRDRYKGKLVVVDKHAGSGREIVSMPAPLQYIAMGVADEMMNVLEWKSGGTIRFKDQRPNQRLAVESSITRENATIDLKGASNSVSLWAVNTAMPQDIVPDLMALRPSVVMGRLLKRDRKLKMFAPMGSGLTFPLLATFVWSITVTAMESIYGWKRLDATRRVHVFGDDLVVPKECVPGVLWLLGEWGFKPNRQKSYIHGFFRESCGADAFAGVDVTPIRIKAMVPTSGRSAKELVSLSQQAYAFEKRGYAATSMLLYRTCEKAINKPLPYGLPSSGFLCRRTESWGHATAMNRRLIAERKLKSRWNDRFQRLEYKVWRITPFKEPDTLVNWSRLLRNLLIGAPKEEDADVPVPNGPVLFDRTWASL